MAWILGTTHPSENALPLLPKVTPNGSTVHVTFRCLKSHKRGGIPLKVQTSTDLGINDFWTANQTLVPDESATVNGIVFVTTDEGDSIQVTANIPTAGAKLFVRLSAEPNVP